MIASCPVVPIFMATPASVPVVPRGIDWLTPLSWVDEEPKDREDHDNIVRAAKAWLRGSLFAWIEPIAEVYGLMFFSDGREVAILSPGLGDPPHLARTTLGVISDADAAQQAGGTRQ